MQVDVHHLIVEEFLKASHGNDAGRTNPVVAICGFATLSNVAALQQLSPDEIYNCLVHVRRPDVPDGRNEAFFEVTGTSFRFDITSIRADRTTLGRIARVERTTEPGTRDGDGVRGLTLDSVVRGHIARALRLTQGNRVRAARLLGISRSALYRKLAVYGLQWY